MLHQTRSHLPRLQPTLRLFISSRITNTHTNIVRSFQAQQASSRVTARHCSSTAGDDDKMTLTSKYLEESHQRIFDNNRKWVESMKADDADFFVKLGAGQTPEYLFVFPPSHTVLFKSHRNLADI